MIKIESTRQIDGNTTEETRYYITSEEGFSACYYNSLVRGHWGIENKLHWHLDVTFKTLVEQGKDMPLEIYQL